MQTSRGGAAVLWTTYFNRLVGFFPPAPNFFRCEAYFSYIYSLFHELQVAEAGNGTDKLSGLTLKYPGGPDMYDHEAHAYASGRPLSAAMLTQAQTLARAVDGFIVPSSTVLEPVGVRFCRELYVKRGQEVFTIGTQVDEECWNGGGAVEPSNETAKAFLDSAVREYGPKSVLYISFG
jgi:hypothetical protein